MVVIYPSVDFGCIYYSTITFFLLFYTYPYDITAIFYCLVC